MKINHRRNAKKAAKKLDGMVAHTMHVAPVNDKSRAKYEQRQESSHTSRPIRNRGV